MVKHAPGAGMDCCPHIDRNDQRCGHRFSLGRLDQAFCVCFEAYNGCPMYHRLNREAGEVPSESRPSAGRPAPLMMVTSNGDSITLRPTGT